MAVASSPHNLQAKGLGWWHRCHSGAAPGAVGASPEQPSRWHSQGLLVALVMGGI